MSASFGLPLAQPPSAVHAPKPVQASPSSQPAPTLITLRQPVAGRQLSAVQVLLSSQLAGTVPGWHAPPLQLSPMVQALPSEHGIPLKVNGLWTHAPLVPLQLSAVHAALSSQFFSTPRHVPPLQWSPTVHRLPSSHVGALLAVWLQPVVALHGSSVHGLASSQLSAAPP